MPVHFYTFHAHGSFTSEPSPQRELFQRDRFGGLCQQRPAQPTVRFTADHQRKLVDTVIDSQGVAGYRCFGVVAQRQRMHLLVAWEGKSAPETIRSQIKGAVTTAMNAEFGPRAWLSQIGRDKRVRNRTHFEYLITSFFPKQRGLMWTYAARHPQQRPQQRHPSHCHLSHRHLSHRYPSHRQRSTRRLTTEKIGPKMAL